MTDTTNEQGLLEITRTEDRDLEADGKVEGKLPPMLTVDELSAFLRVDRKTVYEMIADRQLPGCVRVGRVIRISTKAILDWLDGKVMPPAKRARTRRLG